MLALSAPLARGRRFGLSALGNTAETRRLLRVLTPKVRSSKEPWRSQGLTSAMLAVRSAVRGSAPPGS